jgi:hypothetical protein
VVSAAVALTAASGASMPAPRGYAQDETPGHISSRVGKIKKWRRGHLVRVPNGGPVAEIPVSVEPTPTAQLPWHAYRMQSDPHYEMIAVEFLVDITERAQPLAGCIDKPLKQVMINGRRMEHFHSIDRIAELAMSHPEVAEVEKHNLHKQYDLSEFGETAPASSSLTNSVVDREMARMIFYDIAEAQHKEPVLGEYWRQAWETVGPEEGDEDEDDGSTQRPAGSAQVHPASRGEVAPSQPLRPQPPPATPPQFALAATAPVEVIGGEPSSPEIDGEPSQDASAPEVDEDGCSLCPASGGEMSVTPAAPETVKDEQVKKELPYSEYDPDSPTMKYPMVHNVDSDNEPVSTGDDTSQPAAASSSQQQPAAASSSQQQPAPASTSSSSSSSNSNTSTSSCSNSTRCHY